MYRIKVEYGVNNNQLCQACLQVIEADEGLDKAVLSRGQPIMWIRYLAWDRVVEEVSKEIEKALRCIEKKREERRRKLEAQPPDTTYII